MDREQETEEQGSPGKEPAFEDSADGDDVRREPTVADLLRKITVTMETENDKAEGLPPQPRSFSELGLSRAFLTDLVLKIIHYSGTPSTAQLRRRVGLPPGIIQPLLTTLMEERLVAVISQSDLYTGNYRYRLTDRGHQRGQEALDRTRYAGPAPVTAEQYAEVVKRQSRQRQRPSQNRIQESLSELVLSPKVADAVGRALYSSRSALLFGPSGNGKSSILERFAHHVEGTVVIPYAIYAHGQVIRVFDPSIHVALEAKDERNVMKDEGKFDHRWVTVKRPAVILGAELGAESLELTYDPQSRFYQAPPHIKAQGGVLIVDDFGRQKVDARSILARWLIPLERGWDSLSLTTGEKVAVPFDVQILFATNLPIEQLADEALLRRILYKVEIPNPSPEEFAELLKRLCQQQRVLLPEGAVNHVVQALYSQPDLEPRAAYARDLLQIVVESARFDGREPSLDAESFDKAFQLIVMERGKTTAAPSRESY